MTLQKLFYHLVWSTKYRAALLTPDIELTAHDIMRSKAIQLGGYVYALNGTETHIHFIATIPTRIAVAHFVGQVKGIVAFRLNQAENNSTVFRWQHEYSVFTFDEKRLASHVRYVELQKTHHARGNLIPILEQTGEVQPNRMQETTVPYGLEKEDAEWWQALLSLT